MLGNQHCFLAGSLTFRLVPLSCLCCKDEATASSCQVADIICTKTEAYKKQFITSCGRLSRWFQSRTITEWTALSAVGWRLSEEPELIETSLTASEPAGGADTEGTNTSTVTPWHHTAPLPTLNTGWRGKEAAGYNRNFFLFMVQFPDYSSWRGPEPETTDTLWLKRIYFPFFAIKREICKTSIILASNLKKTKLEKHQEKNVLRCSL